MDKLKELIQGNPKWEHLSEYIETIEKNTSPPNMDGIEACKCLLEAIFKTILIDVHCIAKVEIPTEIKTPAKIEIPAKIMNSKEIRKLEFPKLFRFVAHILNIQSYERYSISNVCCGICEMRNKFGTKSHGKDTHIAEKNNEELGHYLFDYWIFMTETISYYILYRYRLMLPTIFNVKEIDTSRISYKDKEHIYIGYFLKKLLDDYNKNLPDINNTENKIEFQTNNKHNVSPNSEGTREKSVEVYAKNQFAEGEPAAREAESQSDIKSHIQADKLDVIHSVNLRMEVINRLINSGSFARTHEIIEELSKYEEFSNEELKLIFQAFRDNSQVNWISGDPDLVSFFDKTIMENKELFNPVTLGELLFRRDNLK